MINGMLVMCIIGTAVAVLAVACLKAALGDWREWSVSDWLHFVFFILWCTVLCVCGWIGV